MTCSVRFARAALVGGGLLGVGCGESSAPVAPTTLVAVAGEGQFWIVGAPLPVPLRVRVTGSDAQPLAGATVSWGVTAGSATVGAASSETDSLGIAAMTVTLGAVAEAVAVRAAVTGLQPVTFSATACAVSAFTLGATISAALATTDCRTNGFYTDVYSLDLTSGQQGLTISDSSGTFDTYLELYRGDGAFVAVNDDIDPGVIQNSLIAAIVAPGSYILAPSSFDPDTTGAYSLSVLSRPQALADCDLVWVTRGITVTDSVTATDCVDSSGPFYADRVVIFADAGSVLTIAERSTAFDAELFLQTAAGIAVASNDDSANASTTTNAYLVYPVAQTGLYLLFAATDTTSATGAYTLTISASSTLSGSPRHGGAPQLLRITPLRMPKGLPRRGWSR